MTSTTFHGSAADPAVIAIIDAYEAQVAAGPSFHALVMALMVLVDPGHIHYDGFAEVHVLAGAAKRHVAGPTSETGEALYDAVDALSVAHGVSVDSITDLVAEWRNGGVR